VADSGMHAGIKPQILGVKDTKPAPHKEPLNSRGVAVPFPDFCHSRCLSQWWLQPAWWCCRWPLPRGKRDLSAQFAV